MKYNFIWDINRKIYIAVIHWGNQWKWCFEIKKKCSFFSILILSVEKSSLYELFVADVEKGKLCAFLTHCRRIKSKSNQLVNCCDIGLFTPTVGNPYLIISVLGKSNSKSGFQYWFRVAIITHLILWFFSLLQVLVKAWQFLIQVLAKAWQVKIQVLVKTWQV